MEMMSSHTLPSILALIGLVIWCWPRKSPSDPRALTHEQHEKARKAYDRGSWWRFFLAMTLLVASVVLALVTEVKAG